MADAQPDRFSALFRSEDCWAIWLGVLLLAVGVAIFLPNRPEGMDETLDAADSEIAAEQAREPGFKTIAWHRALAARRKLSAAGHGLGKTVKKFVGKPHGWGGNPLDALFLGEARAKSIRDAAAPKLEKAQAAEAEALAAATAAEETAAAAGFADEALGADARDRIDEWLAAKEKVGSAAKKAGTKPMNQLPWLLGLGLVLCALFGVGLTAMGHSFTKFSRGFGFVFALAVVSYIFAAQADMKALGIGYAAFAIVIGLLISNTIGTPDWVKPAVQTEFYIKTGLVLLGAEILFSRILAIGVPGIFVAWVVTPIVLITTFWFGQKVIKIPSKTLNMTISADMSVCGVSAAIATAAACRAKKEELTVAVGMSLIFTSIMMVVMPIVIKAVGMNHVLGGAWMGGTIDATGAVAAAGAFLSETALSVAATVKMIQNVLIGVIAFAVALYWVTKVERVEGHKVSAMEIWYRFPKFVLGFIGASIVFSLLYGALGEGAGQALVHQGVLKGMTSTLRGWFFCLAFVSIGLATNFRELRQHFRGGKPLILYVCGQSLNLLLTLLMAWIMFFLVFPSITKAI